MYIYDEAEEQAIALINNKKVILLIRGSDSPHDWLKNFSTLPSRLALDHALIGFDKSAKELIQWLELILKINHSSLDQQFYHIKIIGHSRGGGIAKLMAKHLERRPYWLLGEVYTYGAPKPESSSLGRGPHLDQSVFNIKLLKDPVADMPLRFDEIGKSYLFDFKEEVCEQLEKRPLISVKLVDHHRIATYQNCLKLLLSI